MTNDAYHYPEHDCSPTKNPADQPQLPRPGDCHPPYDIVVPEPPCPPPCPPPDPWCKCPSDPTNDPADCLVQLVAHEQGDTGAADQAKFKAELTKLLETARKATQDYTRDKYLDLVDRWVKQDAVIAELLRKLECAVPCWKCILDCFVCPLLNNLHNAEKWLYDDGQLYTEAHDLYDQQYLLQRARQILQRRFDRVKAVLKAWETPASTIEKAMNDNKTLIDSIGPLIGSQPGKAIYDVFFRLIPLHLAIAPPQSDKTTTRIDKRFTEFCCCDTGTLDDCCGPDVGERSLRQRLLPPQPYLIDPNVYYGIICCLIEKRYRKAKDDLFNIDVEIAKVNAKIDGFVKALADGWQKDFEKNAKAAIPSVIDCCDYVKDDSSQSR